MVKDGHGDATNIDVMAMPEGVTLIRGKSGHPVNMMFGLDETFDAVLYIGYHAPAGDPGQSDEPYFDRKQQFYPAQRKTDE